MATKSKRICKIRRGLLASGRVERWQILKSLQVLHILLESELIIAVLVAPARPPDCGLNPAICNPNPLAEPLAPPLVLHWANIGHLCSQSSQSCPSQPVPKHSGYDFVLFFCDFDAFWIHEIMGKPQKNLGFSMVFINSAILVQNR